VTHETSGLGQTVWIKKHGTVWRVMEKREIWQNIVGDPQSRVLPAIYLAYRKVQRGVLPGIGKMFGYSYTPHDNTFDANWEVVEED